MTTGGFVMTGQGVRVYQALALKHGMELYRKTGLKPNSAWTEHNMLRTATAITRHAYGHGPMAVNDAINDLTVWLEAQKPMEG
jgi:hypothetical protein